MRRRFALFALVVACAPLGLACEKDSAPTRVPAELRGRPVSFGEDETPAKLVNVDMMMEIDGKVRMRGRSFQFLAKRERSVQLGLPNDREIVARVDKDETTLSVPKAGLYEVEDKPRWRARLDTSGNALTLNGKKVEGLEGIELRAAARELIDNWLKSADLSGGVQGRTIRYGETVTINQAAGMVELRLVEVIGRRGKQQAVFELRGNGESLSADSMGLNRVNAVFDGEAVIDVDTGRLIRLTSVGPIRGTMADSDGRARVRGTMKFEYRVRYL